MGAGGASIDPSWVGWELNPRDDGVRVRCNANFCYRPKIAKKVVPPPGIEPGPLGLQPSAQTNYAKVGRGRRAAGMVPVRGAFFVGALPGHPHHRSSVVRDLPRRAQGAPRAVMHPRDSRIHLSRIRDRDCYSRFRVARIRLSSPRRPGARVGAARNEEGPPGFFPGGPWRCVTRSRQLRWVLRRGLVLPPARSLSPRNSGASAASTSVAQAYGRCHDGIVAGTCPG